MNLLNIFTLHIITVISLLFPLSVPALERNPIPDEKPEEFLTTGQWRMAEETVGNPESADYDEAAFETIVRKALKSPLLNEADRLRAGYRLEIMSKNRIGSVATDFSFKSREGSVMNLLSVAANRNLPDSTSSDIDEKPILLLFYDPDCGHCIETIEELKCSELANLLSIVAIDAEEDYDIWNETADRLPKEWTVGFALDPVQDEDIYIFLTTPTLYLLSPDKRILLKDTTLSKIAEFMKNR